MNKINVSLVIAGAVLIALLGSGCSKPTANQPDLGPHPQGWLDQSSPNFHGTQVINSGFADVTNSCANCHLTAAAGDTTWDCWSCHSYYPHLHTNQGIEGFKHGGAVRNAGYQVWLCRACHGQFYNDGPAGINCNICHVNTPEACNTCHGTFGASPADTSSFAPPPNLLGSRDSTQVTVGAHRQHVKPQTITFEPVIGHAYSCTECHVMPDSVRAPGHIDTNPPVATIAFGPLATHSEEQPAINPVWNPTNATCSATYCHGDFAFGNPANPPPVWTKQDGSQIACGTCHAMPPPPETGHPDNNNCHQCHASVVGADNVTIVAPELHVNGQLNQ